MRIIHRVDRTVDGKTTSEVVVYDFPEGAANYWERIYDALMDYCATPEGRKRVANGQMLTYADFLDFVPAEICLKHGFSRVLASEIAEHYQGQVPLAQGYGIVHYLRHRDQAQAREAEIQRIIPQLAKAMTDMRSEPTKMDKWSFWKIANTAVQWSTEYVDSGAADLRGFVRRKLDAQTTPKIKA